MSVLLPLVMLDSNMYGEGGWFYSGFNRIHEDQTDWCMARLDALKADKPDIKAMAFFHMPPREFKEAYEKSIRKNEALIARRTDGSIDIRMRPLGSVVSQHVRGAK